MQYGQPPSWRPDRNQLEVEVYRGTVREALGGLRNLEQLLGSRRVGPRALLSVLPDIQASCAPLEQAVVGLADIVSVKLSAARNVVMPLSQAASARLAMLAGALDAMGKATFNAKARLSLEEQVVSARIEIESIFELIDLLGEATWGRTMPLDLAEVAREAFRSSEPPGDHGAAIRLTLCADEGPSVEREANPRAVGLLLNLLVRLQLRLKPDMVPRVVFEHHDDRSVVVAVEPNGGSGEHRWTNGRACLDEAEICLRLAAEAMQLRVDFGPDGTRPRLLFPPD